MASFAEKALAARRVVLRELPLDGLVAGDIETVHEASALGAALRQRVAAELALHAGAGAHEMPAPKGEAPAALGTGRVKPDEVEAPVVTEAMEVPLTTVDGVDYVMPERFGLVEEGVYRCSFPSPAAFPFLEALGLKTIINLLDQLPPEYESFISARGLEYYHLAVKGNKESAEDMDRGRVARAIAVMMDTRKHPVLIHCRSGKHRTGAVIGCLRMLQRWSLEAAHREYQLYCREKERQYDYLYIRAFDEAKDMPGVVPPRAFWASWVPAVALEGLPLASEAPGATDDEDDEGEDETDASPARPRPRFHMFTLGSSRSGRMYVPGFPSTYIGVGGEGGLGSAAADASPAASPPVRWSLPPAGMAREVEGSGNSGVPALALSPSVAVGSSAGSHSGASPASVSSSTSSNTPSSASLARSPLPAAFSSAQAAASAAAQQQKALQQQQEASAHK